MTLLVSLLRPVKFLVVALACSLLLVSNAFPAWAIESSPSKPTDSTEQLLEIQKKTDEIAKSAPPGLNKVQEESNKGLNEVQGAADIEKMKRPENSQEATSVESEVQNFLEKVTGKQ